MRTKVMLLGQAPGRHELERDRPFAYTAGRRLFSWFAEELQVDEARFRSAVYIAAVIRCFPGKDPSGGDRVPDDEEIDRCGRYFDREVRLLRPRLVIATGTLASSVLLGTMPLKESVGRLHEAKRAGIRFDVVVLPHPSGRSTWMNKEENRRQLRASLQIIGGHPAWTMTTG